MQPVALTAFYCCALRAADAASPSPVCGDTFAARFIDEATRSKIKPLLRFRGPAAGNVARHRIIDDMIRDSIKEDPFRRVILLGAGFDSRAFRLSGGRWWEFDDSALFALKGKHLPADSAPNPLVRFPTDFRRERLSDRLAPLAGDDPALVVLEGVSMYLPPAILTELATAARVRLPRAHFVCDLMTTAFCRRFGRGLLRELRSLGAEFAITDTHARLAIEAAGYRPVSITSIVGRAREAGTAQIPGWLFNTVLRELRDGYAVWRFQVSD
jgi:methyltransferase (TIGR00027 family)